MLLRTRITWIAAAGLLLTVLGLLGGSLLREQVLQQRLAQTAQAALAAQWAEALATEDRVIEQAIDKLLLAPLAAESLRQGAPDALAAALAGAGLVAGPGQPWALAALLGTGRAPQVQGQRPPGPLLDVDSLERASVGDTADGLRVLGDGRALVLAARRLPGQGEALVLLLARDASHVLAQMARHTGAALALLDLHGRLLHSTDAALWQAAAAQVAQRGAQYAELELQARSYAVSGVPVHDLAGHAAGTLILLADQTPAMQASRFLGRLALGGTALLVLLGLLGLNWYLRRSLQPLERSIDALQALAQGDASVQLPYSGHDEIGRIARAVATFRRNTEELVAARALRERVRRRQERLLRTKLQALAEATQQPLALAAGHSDEEQLRQLAGVMNELSGRLIDQHRQLTGMVQELREALITKTRLAGLEQELQIAAQVQLSILPRQPPQDARVQLHCHITPAREVGGDFYDYFLIDDQHLGFVIADVSGKGVPAALFMTITRTLLKATAQFVAEPTRCVAQLNDLLAAENEQMMFVTLFYGVLRLDSGELRYVNAGHNPPYVLHGDGRAVLLARTGGVAVAVSEGFAYREGNLRLRPGEQLFLYTDGVTEAFDADGQEYGDARLSTALHAALAATDHRPEDVVGHVLADVHAFERGAPQADDITCVALRYLGTTNS